MGADMLRQVLTPDVIRLKARATDWEDAVRQSVGLLQNVGAVEPRYVDASVQMVKDLGAYMVLAPGLALAHARPEAGVRRNCLALLTLETPVAFGHPENDPVYVVFALGAIKSDEHVKLIADLAQFLEREETIAALGRAETAEEVLALLDQGSSR
jgi:mannitol/fructose-specific phosphotransferase system IIA component (Ntr-type)